MKNLVILLTIMSSLFLSSCMTTRTAVGDYREIQGDTFTYSKGKQCYLFWGLLPIGRTNIATPRNGSCEVRTSYRFWDFFLTGITGGIFSMQTIKIKAKRSAETSCTMPAAAAGESQDELLTVTSPQVALARN